MTFRNHDPDAHCAPWCQGGSQALLVDRVATVYLEVCAHTQVLLYLCIYLRIMNHDLT